MSVQYDQHSGLTYTYENNRQTFNLKVGDKVGVLRTYRGEHRHCVLGTVVRAISTRVDVETVVKKDDDIRKEVSSYNRRTLEKIGQKDYGDYIRLISVLKANEIKKTLDVDNKRKALRKNIEGKLAPLMDRDQLTLSEHTANELRAIATMIDEFCQLN